MNKYQPKTCPPDLLSKSTASYGAGHSNECFTNAFVAANKFQPIDAYVLGWLYFKSKNKSEKSPVEHAWIKSGNLYYDPTPLDKGTHSGFRYAPMYELSSDKANEIIYSRHSSEECELIKKGKLEFEPPNMKEVKEFLAMKKGA
ncbi:MAG: hypothetical protein ACXWTX_06565 [Gallionella sp.]